MRKLYLSSLFIILCSLFLFAKNPPIGIGSDAAVPEIEKVLITMPIYKNEIYMLSDEDVERLISKAAEIRINIFELLDCIYRYLSKNKMRIEIQGSSLKKLLDRFDFGQKRVLAILPIPIIDKIQTGAVFQENQKTLQVFLTEKYENYIEIGTAMYETEFGFNKLEPNLFSDSYGMRVKKIGIKKTISKIHLYENGKGAIYVRGFFRPKRWYLWLITKKK